MATCARTMLRRRWLPWHCEHRARRFRTIGGGPMRYMFCPIVALAGCAVSSGVHRIGGDEYTVTTSASPGRGGVPASKRMANEQAAAACSEQSLSIFVIDEVSNSPTFTDGMANTTLRFRCEKAKAKP